MRDIAAQHGYYYDGVHPGDYYQLRLILDIAREMEELCPDAMLIQSANPVSFAADTSTAAASTVCVKSIDR